MSDISQNPRKWLAEWGTDLLVCLRFCTRVPIRTFAFERPPAEASIAAAASMLPLAGAIIGLVAAIALWILTKLGVPSSLGALLAVAALVVLTGALHEDGLADFADALGGATPEQRLAIMKDSRIGTFGALALAIVLLGRVIAIALLTDHSLGLACAVLIAAGASSRCFALVPLYLLAPARKDGLGAAAVPDEPKRYGLLIAVVSTLVVNLLPLCAGAGLGRIILALILGAAAAYLVTVLARRLLQGQTGDVAGAAQQIAELTPYIVFSAHL